MNRRQLLTTTIAAPLAMAQNRQRSLRERLIGSWKLISWEETNPGTGEVSYPLGKNAMGSIVYDPGGHMSAQVMNPNRPKSSPPPGSPYAGWANSLSLEDARAILSGYVAYYGRFDVDEAKRTVTHHVQGDLWAYAIGVERLRKVDFLADDRIVLSYTGGLGENRLVWEREQG
jgi:hypothetical protein